MPATAEREREKARRHRERDTERERERIYSIKNTALRERSISRERERKRGDRERERERGLCLRIEFVASLGFLPFFLLVTDVLDFLRALPLGSRLDVGFVSLLRKRARERHIESH